ncbi:MAG: hypothetical protein ABIE22_02800 [archaeon]
MFGRKKRPDVVDLGLMHKKGIIKMPQPSEEEEEYADLGKATISSSENALGFLGAMAESSTPSLRAEPLEGGMKNRVEDVEFKLDSMMRRLDKMIDRIDLVEKKLDRFEGRA